MMIYVALFTQLLTVSVIAAGLYLGKEFLEKQNAGRDAYAEYITRESIAGLAKMSDAHDASMREIVAACDTRVQDILKQAQHEREMILERYQFPENVAATAMATAPAAKSPEPGGARVMDEKKMHDLEDGDPLPETDPHDDIVRPIKPVTPFGARADG